MTAPNPQRAVSAEDRDRLREALAFAIADEFMETSPTTPRRMAWLLVKGPLVPLFDRLIAAEARAEEAEKALTKIDAIRNSIIGFQTVNWSEHVYPLVAALTAAGFEGMDYDVARENAGTLLDQIKAAEADRDRLADEVARLRGALKPFADEADRYDPNEDDNEDLLWHCVAGDLRIRHLRAARALTTTGGTTDDQA